MLLSGPVFLVRHSSDGAGVDDIAIAGFLKAADLVAKIREEPLHGLGLILICLTSEGIKGNFHLVKSTNNVMICLF